MKVLLIGSYPPPLGGVSVFVKRYGRLLEAEGHTVETLDPEKLSRRQLYSALWARARRFDLISLHFPSLHIMLALFALGLAARTEVGEHNWRVLERWPAWQRRFYSLFIRRCREVRFVAPHLVDYYRAHGVSVPPRMRVEHPFIPPPAEEEASILAAYPPDVHQFVGGHRPLLLANAFRLVMRDGVDLYGLDLCIELIARLRDDYPRVGLLFALAEAGGDYYENATRELAARGLTGHIHFLAGQQELWPLFKKADLFVRPTLTDGYALSLAEALYFDCPSVASDASPRPAGTILFANRNLDEFERRCRAAIDGGLRVKG